MARLLLWAILLVLFLRSASRLLRGVLEGAGYTRDGAAQRSVGLVRDPVCGVFVVPGQALTAGTGSEARYFCSEKCRREWMGRGRR
jgi:YHS domain-containing protein